MLVFSRKKGEYFVLEIGDEVVKISINNFSTSPKQAQLGIEAPKHIKVWRSEIYEAILENREATKVHTTSPSALKSMFKKED